MSMVFLLPEKHRWSYSAPLSTVEVAAAECHKRIGQLGLPNGVKVINEEVSTLEARFH
jgi:hypothetical protein